MATQKDVPDLNNDSIVKMKMICSLGHTFLFKEYYSIFQRYFLERVCQLDVLLQ